MLEPVVARPKPCLVALEAGRKYFWCSCGRSTNQPFCDGSHKGSGFAPRQFVAVQTDEALLCCCKQTATPPFCDGAHSNLDGGSPVDDPDSPENRRIRLVEERDGPRVPLNGGCYILSPALVPQTRRGSLAWRTLASAEHGAVHQTQILLEVRGGGSPVVSFRASEAILLVLGGSGSVDISGRKFAVKATDGVSIRPNEAIRLTANGTATLRVIAVASPIVELDWPSALPENFDASLPQRVAAVDEHSRVRMGSRYFQILVDKRLGSRIITQFIGHIPRSKAAPHRHLYEETLIVLSGNGCMWTEDRRARVGAGDVIFLPRKQLHSLEAISPEGMFVVGVICPGDNPRVNYYD